VKEAYDVGREAQVKKGEALMEEWSQRSEERERRLTWELEEERRKGQKQRRKAGGIVVKDRLASRIPTPVKPVVRAGPQWRNWNERWEAARKKEAEATKEMGEIRASTASEDQRWGVEAPKHQHVDAGRGRGARRPGRPCQTDMRLGMAGTDAVRDMAADP
jgi:hypothetical protein